MKNMKKLLQKAMVFTLTAAMLIGTPLTASAAGLADLYQIEDGWGNVTDHKDNTRTGTVTATQTNSGILDANATLEGISLNETNVELEMPNEFELVASLDWNGEENADLKTKLMKSLHWESGDTAIAALRVANRSYNGGTREKITVVPKAAGTTTVTVSLDSNEYDIHYSATAKITVLQYADKLEFSDEIKTDAVTGNAIPLDDYVIRYADGKPVATTSDKLTYALNLNGNKGAATLNAKTNVLTLKKVTAADKPIKLLVVGKNVKSGWCELAVTQGHNAKTIVIKGDGVNNNKLDLRVNDGLTREVTAEVTDTKDGEKPCTDRISWSSKKPKIVSVSTGAPMKLTDGKTCKVTLTAHSVGKTQITAKASSGKSVTLSVAVSADLSSIEVEAPKALYSGQTVDLYGMTAQYFGKDKTDKTEEANVNFTDAGLKWSITTDKSVAKNLATINAKGVLNVKPNLPTGAKEIEIKVENAKKTSKEAKGAISTTFKVPLTQVSVTSIVVTKGKTTKMADAVIKDGKIQKGNVKNQTDPVAVNGTRVYNITVKGMLEGETAVRELPASVVGWSASGNGKTVKASRNNVGNGVIKALKKGTSTVTINSSAKKGNKNVAVKITFKVKVNAPTKTISLSVKNRGIAATGKQQTISITPVLDKGCTTNKSKDIVWSAKKNGQAYKAIDQKGKLKDTFTAGDKIVVTAKVMNGGPKTSITLTVVKPSKNVEFQQNNAKVTKDNLNVGTEKTYNVKINLNTKPASAIDANAENAAAISYSVNKDGIVRIIPKADGTVTIDPIMAGKVTITAKTSDGKTGKLKVNVQ